MKRSREDRGRRYQDNDTVDYNRKRSNESINASDKRDYRGKIDMDSEFTQPRYRSNTNEDQRYHIMNQDKTSNDAANKASNEKKIKLEEAESTRNRKDEDGIKSIQKANSVTS